jgi:raffinose/stachyose/melibiose transport system substrate-binding protein
MTITASWTCRARAVLLSAALATASLAVTGHSPISTARAADPTVITVWSWTPVTPTMTAMIAAIEKAHPDIQIKATISPHPVYSVSLQAAVGSGNMPDIIGLSPGAETQQYRPHLLKLGAVAAGLWGADWQKNFSPALLTEARLGNPAGDTDFYALPQEAQLNNLWYNIPAFKKAGLDGPPKTLDELVADAEKLRAAGFIPFYQGASTGTFDVWTFLQIALQTDQEGVLAGERGEPVWDKPGMIEAAHVWQRLFTDHVFQPGALSALQYPTGANLFAAGRVGIISLGSWWLQQTGLSDQPGLKTMSDYGIFSFPAVRNGGAATPPFGGVDFGWGITDTASKSPAELAAAKIVLKEFISGVGEQEALNQLNDLPAFNGKTPGQTMPPHLTEVYDSYIKQLASAHPHVIGDPVINQSLISGLQAIGAGSMTPEAAMQAVQKTALAQQKAN